MTRSITDYPSVLAFSHSNQLIAVGTSVGTIIIWDAQKLEVKAILGDNSGEVASLVFSPDDQTLASSSYAGMLTLWNINSQQSISQVDLGKTHPCNLHKAYEYPNVARPLAFSPDGKILVGGTMDCALRFWDVSNLNPLVSPLHGHIGATIQSIAFSSNGSVIATGGGTFDGDVILWNAQSHTIIAKWRIGDGRAIIGLAFSPDDKLITAFVENGKIYRLESSSGNKLTDFSSDSSMIASISSDGQFLAYGKNDPTTFQANLLILRDTLTGIELGESSDPSGTIKGLSFSTDGSLLAIGTWDENEKNGKIKIIQIKSMNQDRKITTFDRGGYSIDLIISISPEENRCYLENGSDLIVREIDWFNQHLKEKQLLRPLWWGYAVSYFAPKIGYVEQLRIAVENKILEAVPECRGYVLRHKIGGVDNIDTSGLGNIAFGYFLNNPLLPQYLRDGIAEDEISNFAQALNDETWQEIVKRCGRRTNVSCIINNILMQSDNSDDTKQRQVGRNLQIAVERGENLSVRTLERVAAIFGLN